MFEKAEIKSYPDGELEEVKTILMDPIKKQAENEKMELTEFLEKYYQMTEEDFEKQAEAYAKESVGQKLVAWVIAEEENLVPGDSEWEKEYEALAEKMGFGDVDALKKAAEASGEPEEVLKDVIIQNRVREFLAEYAIQVKK